MSDNGYADMKQQDFLQGVKDTYPGASLVFAIAAKIVFADPTTKELLQIAEDYLPDYYDELMKDFERSHE